MSFKIASVNLNKGLATTRRRSLVQRWTIKNQSDLILAQEPWAHSVRVPIDLEGFAPIGGNSRVFAWINETLESPVMDQATPAIQRLRVGYVILYNVYLSPYARVDRAQQLRDLLDLLRTEEDRPVLIFGDFNLAPESIDGLTNSLPSHFNSEVDRAPFQCLLKEGHLIDSTRSRTPEYSIVRRLGSQRSEFRCDLCLISDYFRQWVAVNYDHSTRVGSNAFTDHSALSANLPISFEQTARYSGRLFSWRDVETHSRIDVSLRGQSSHKTAMARTRESAVARLVVNNLVPRLKPKKILDHGCGRGADVQYYISAGLQATGYDPHPAFGHDQRPQHQKFDLVVSAFVLNVLSNPWERLRALKDAGYFLTNHGRLLVVTRSSTEISQTAARAGWKIYNDGFLSSQARDTFQRGIDNWEIVVLAEGAGLEAVSEDRRLPEIPGATQILLKRSPRIAEFAVMAQAGEEGISERLG